jgi:hypothetical protein
LEQQSGRGAGCQRFGLHEMVALRPAQPRAFTGTVTHVALGYGPASPGPQRRGTDAVFDDICGNLINLHQD